MRPAFLNSRWIAATVCVVAMSSAMADDGVIRLSDSDTEPADDGVIRLSHQDPAPPRASLAPPNSRSYYESGAYCPAAHFDAYARLYGKKTDTQLTDIQPVAHAATIPDYGMMGIADAGYGIPADIYSPGCGMGADCYGGWGMESGGCPGDCNCDSCRGKGKGKRMPNREFRKALKNHRECSYCDGFQARVRLLARAIPKDSCYPMRWPKRFWRGQQYNYLARNQHLANALFGWMVPSGCCGQGCPPVGCYDITYADDPGYSHDQDMMQYGAQGYGSHVNVPLAPTVRYGYNYSWGTPSSRLTQVGTYDPQTSPQPLYRPTF